MMSQRALLLLPLLVCACAGSSGRLVNTDLVSDAKRARADPAAVAMGREASISLARWVAEKKGDSIRISEVWEGRIAMRARIDSAASTDNEPTLAESVEAPIDHIVYATMGTGRPMRHGYGITRIIFPVELPLLERHVASPPIRPMTPLPDLSPPTYRAEELASHLFYPLVPAETKIQGAVRVSALIDEKGKVRAVALLKRVDPFLDAVALDAVAKTSYTPATRKGTPIEMSLVLSISFRVIDQEAVGRDSD